MAPMRRLAISVASPHNFTLGDNDDDDAVDDNDVDIWMMMMHSRLLFHLTDTIQSVALRTTTIAREKL